VHGRRGGGARAHTQAEDGAQDEGCAVLAESSTIAAAHALRRHTQEQQHEAGGELRGLADGGVVRRSRSGLPDV
jgi:hypothetical protein